MRTQRKIVRSLLGVATVAVSTAVITSGCANIEDHRANFTESQRAQVQPVAWGDEVRCSYPSCLSKSDLEGLQQGQPLRVDAMRLPETFDRRILHFLRPTESRDLTDEARSACTRNDCSARDLMLRLASRDPAGLSSPIAATAYGHGAMIIFQTERVKSENGCQGVLLDTYECRDWWSHALQYLGLPSCFEIKTHTLVISEFEPRYMIQRRFEGDERKLTLGRNAVLAEAGRIWIDVQRRRVALNTYIHKVCGPSQIGQLQ